MRNGKVITLILLFVSMTSTSHAQKLWSQVKLDRSSAYIGQPVEVSITVYTSTWFTSGLDMGNIQVDGAYTVYFRPVSVSLMEGRMTYPGVQLIYHVFPNSEKDIVFPSLSLVVESPEEGNWVGVKHTLRTKARTIKVKPVPPGFEQSDWMVATGMYVSDHWSGNLKKVKVGDVLERRITRTAYGTVGELIPAAAWDSIGHVSMYPDRTSINNNRGKTSISSSRSESMRYLFESEGEVIMPKMVFTYYHPYRQRLYKKTLKEITIEVLPNPDLNVLKSVRDSLLVQQQQMQMAEEEDQPLTILGLSPTQFAAAVIILLLVLYFMARWIRRLVTNIQRRREAYLHSELYYFDQFRKAVKKKDSNKILNSLYRWLDELDLVEPSLQSFAKTYGDERLMKEFEKLSKSSILEIRINFQLWKSARRNYFENSQRMVETKQMVWINP